MNGPASANSGLGPPDPDRRPVRVVHVNDVAGVASAAVAQADAMGIGWRLWAVPAVQGLPAPAKGARRLRDLAAFHATGRWSEVLHVHYGLFAYYAWSVCRPYLLHLHGTDVRANLNSRALRPLVLRAIRRAGAVVYSTPDLAAAVTSLRPDARWLPAPLHPLACRPVAPSRHAARATTGPPTVVFASRWDPAKGLDELLRAARDIRGALPDAHLIGVDWGIGASRAAAAGVRLLPLMPSSSFRGLLATADVVIGQLASGVLGIAELEAMALERPLVARFTEQGAYGDEPQLWNTSTVDLLEAVTVILKDPAAAAARAGQARQWALRHHSPAAFVESLVPLYRRLSRGG